MWGEDATVSTQGAPTIVFNVLSKHALAGDTFLGQAVLDMKHKQHVVDGNQHKFKLSVGPLVIPIFDTNGKRLNLADQTAVTGQLEVGINIPSIYDNMCGK